MNMVTYGSEWDKGVRARTENENSMDIPFQMPFESPKCFTYSKNKSKSKRMKRDFPGGAVDKTLHSQCRGSRFDPWSGN